jgi:hypothetical protein
MNDELLNRKQLPAWGVIKKRFDVEKIRQYCDNNGFLDYTKYSDIKYSGNNKAFILSNARSKDNFFLEEEAPSLEGEMYKQISLTDIYEEALVNDEQTILDSGSTYKKRMRRLDPSRPEYVPEADHHNYGKRNKNAVGEFANFLDIFEDQVLRVKLAVIMPGFTIRPHVDFDPTYLVRYHFPIITNDDVVFGARLPNRDTIEYRMPADGSIYFFNSGLLHWVKNGGSEPRLHIVIDVKGQKDLQLVSQ